MTSRHAQGPAERAERQRGREPQQMEKASHPLCKRTS